ncbi:hypothetical protein Daura_27715 [Dactylosporangium aurantiacum]|uniref:Uncharacterized protein n=1 Tax=Dactylosporangium aurantiacum TaxID=35754 RepID=A0A9Q9IAB6_9ACTN|nr:hypothetical protein [Dactylosporangium aurantiacum]MDG6107037.1 hypothetical protein [Dactylosporangium aurantiacum]UWZ50613.1 hypothetical protein Daura_27715 [Dactylosporangium aurantiacum]
MSRSSRRRCADDDAGVGRWRTGGDAGFARVEARHPDGRMAALTNPVVLT